MLLQNKANKKGEVRFAFLESASLLHFFAKYATSETVGKVQSCSVDEIKSDSFKASGFGIYACDDLIGVISYELNESKFRPGYYSAKLDVVSVIPDVRGLGIGALLMGTLYLRIAQYFGYCLVHMSTTAVHPAVGHYVEKLGFTTTNADTRGPLYTINLENSVEYDSFLALCEKDVYQRLSGLRMGCIKCMSFARPKAPWCIK